MTGAVLYTTTRSPFARKVQIVLLEKQVPHSVVLVDLAKRDAAWFRDNPIGKIPVLQLDGVHLPDSTLICETLEDRFPNPPMYEPDRLRCRVIEELADAVGEHTVAAFFAGQRGERAAADRSLEVVDRILDALAVRVATDWPPGFTLADAALVGALGYLGFRHGPGWRERHPTLAIKFDDLAARPSVAQTVPRA